MSKPTVDFSGPSRETAREYAKAADSRILNDDSRKVLKAAAKGKQVDAYALNEAVLDAMRAATTRHGQSMGRRHLATKVAYLGHITQAVLDAHADGLPTYDDTGVRSRKIETLQGEIAALKTAGEHSIEVNQALTRDLTNARNERYTLTQAASDERRRLCAEIDALQNTVKMAARDRDRWLAATYYALDLTDAETGARVKGYIDGWNEAKA